MADAGKSETQLGRLALDRRLVTQEEYNTCLDEQKSLANEGRFLTLTEVMIQQQYVTRSQLERLGGDMEDSIATKAQQIPGYQILGKIGAGAMAMVFKARQLSLDRIVAIKVLSKRHGENRDFVDRFYKEGKAAARLSHNNIVQAIDVGEAGGHHYFVMEYVEGKTVYDDLAANKVYPEKKALEIVLQVANALKHASERDLVHRDVKPKNIMLTRDGVAKLADMGLARATTDQEAAKAEKGRAYGTPYYISPEQILGDEHVDGRADMYSLGATFYHMVTGRVPFDGPTPGAVMNKHLKDELEPPDHINDTLSGGVGEVIELMMKKHPDDRYQNMSDLIRDLEAIRNGKPPLLARERIANKTLEGLKDKAESKPPAAQTQGKTPQPGQPAKPTHLAQVRELTEQVVPLLWVFVLGALLGLSIILNIIQILI